MWKKHQNLLSSNNDAPSITKYGSLVRLDAHSCTALSAPPVMRHARGGGGALTRCMGDTGMAVSSLQTLSAPSRHGLLIVDTVYRHIVDPTTIFGKGAFPNICLQNTVH